MMEINTASKSSTASLDWTSDASESSQQNNRLSTGSGRRNSAIKLTAQLHRTSTTKLSSTKSSTDIESTPETRSNSDQTDVFVFPENIEDNKKMDRCIGWISDQQILQESMNFWTNRKAVEEAVTEQKKVLDAVEKYDKEVEKVRDTIQSEIHKESLNRAYSNLKNNTERRLVCLETMADIADLEIPFGNLCYDISVKAAKLVAEAKKKDFNVAEQFGDVVSSPQGCILAVRKNWNWLLELSKCSGIHLQQASEYHQFFHEMHEYQYWMPAELRKVSELANKSQFHNHPDRNNAATLLLELKTANSIFLHWQNKIDNAFRQSKNITPFRLRTETLDHFCPVLSLCDYRTSSTNVSQGEELTLLDNSDINSWKVKNFRSEVFEVPSIILVIPGPDQEAVETAMKLRLQFLALWTNELKRIGKTLILFLLLAIREWNTEEDNMFRSLKQEDKASVRHLLREIEITFSPYWEPYPSYQKLKLRMEKLRKLLDEKPDINYKGSEEGKSLVIQTEILENILNQYKLSWNNWITTKTLTETIRHPEYLLVVENWNQYKFLELAEWLKHWHTGLEFEDEDFVDNKEMDVEQEEISQLRINKETAQGEQILSSEQEERKRFVIPGVKDPRNNKIVSLDEAIALGITNQRNGTYYNPRTRKSISITEAINSGHIIVETTEINVSEERRRAMGLITINRDVGSYTVFDSRSKKNISVDEAIKRGILNVDDGIYRDVVNGSDLTFDEAIAKGLFIRQIDDEDIGPETITYAVTAVLDIKNKKSLNFEEAVKSNLFDPETGQFTNNETGEEIYVRDAIEREFIKADIVDDFESLHIKPENQVTVAKSHFLQSIWQKEYEPQKTLRMANGTV